MAEEVHDPGSHEGCGPHFYDNLKPIGGGTSREITNVDAYHMQPHVTCYQIEDPHDLPITDSRDEGATASAEVVNQDTAVIAQEPGPIGVVVCGVAAIKGRDFAL